MYVRLAFAVAAHLEPEILLVDEVLAVGDAEFQKKCLGKMRDVARSGRTILFVSHNMAAVQNLCDTAIYLRNGKLVEIGEKDRVIASYLRSTSDLHTIDLADRKDRSGNGQLRFHAVELCNEQGQPASALQSGRPGILRLRLKKSSDVAVIRNLHIAVGIDDEIGQRITNLNNEMTGDVFSETSADQPVVDVRIPRVPFRHGQYALTLYATVNNEVVDWIGNAGSFPVEPGDFFGSGKILPDGQGSFYVEHRFTLH
jgi:lipopolysaccharide transport system ATP-binding protein